MELISVIMSVYNEPRHYVEKAVDSILAQTLKDFEFLIVVDNPQNTSIISYLKTVEQSDQRVRVFLNKQNIGLAQSLNQAIENSHGTYLARMDADDISKPERLERELNFLKTNHLDMVSSLAYKIDENGNICGQINPLPNGRNVISSLLPWQNVIIHPTVLIRADVVRTLRGYRNFLASQDYDLWLRLLTNGNKIGIINEKLLYFRRHSNSVTAQKRFMQLVTEKYIRQLYRERKTGEDSFSETNLENFLSDHGYRNIGFAAAENQRLNDYKSGVKAIKTLHISHGASLIFKSIKSTSVRENIYISIRSNIIKIGFSASTVFQTK